MERRPIDVMEADWHSSTLKRQTGLKNKTKTNDRDWGNNK